jgi:hypothetical protein
MNIFNNMDEEEINIITKKINNEIVSIVESEELFNYFPDQEIVYFNSNGFEVQVSTIPKDEKEKFENLDDQAQQDFPKINYEVELNAAIPESDKILEYSPFKLLINSDERLEISDEKEEEYLEKFKELIMIILGIIMKNLESRLEENKGNENDGKSK